MNEHDVLMTVVVAVCAMLLVIALLTIALVANNNRRMRHRAELAEAERVRETEVARAEREAVQHTLRELGRELHDNVAQLLTVAQLGANNLLEERPEPRLAAMRDALDQGVEELRRLAHGLDADLWSRRSLTDAIVAEAERIERVGRVRAHVVKAGAPLVLDADTSTILFRVFQEVVNNALKHSGADTLTLVLDGGPPATLTISDNGRGFDATRERGQGGLSAIRRRCALIGFEASCSSAPGNGCTWTLIQSPHGA
ncbi:MAG: hypothetical protein H6591_05665 [Flavobacteriales bacterium]|nr:hypothetical protein [Flavobacteriales bacterium]